MNLRAIALAALAAASAAVALSAGAQSPSPVSTPTPTAPPHRVLAVGSNGRGVAIGSNGRLILLGPIGRRFPLLPGAHVSTSHAAATGTPSLVTATPHGTPVDLGVDPDLEDGIRQGEDLILDRRYDDALALFSTIDKAHPDSPLGPLGRMLVYQSEMLENGDFSKQKQFDDEVYVTGKRLDKALDRDKGKKMEVWDHMLSAGYWGTQAMHDMRKKSYLASINAGWDALDDVKSLKKLCPDLADTYLGLGTYDYWRSEITQNVSWIPFFPDKRKSGLAQMERAFVDSQYIHGVAEVVLLYTYLDEDRYHDGIVLGEDLAKKYPHSTLVRVQLGRAYSLSGNYGEALRVFQEIAALQPDNKLVDYYVGANLMYEGRDLDAAESHLRAFLKDPPGDDWKGWAYERLGDVYFKRNDWPHALSYWEQAKELNSDDDELDDKIKSARAHKTPPRPTDTPAERAGAIPTKLNQ